MNKELIASELASVIDSLDQGREGCFRYWKHLKTQWETSLLLSLARNWRKLANDCAEKMSSLWKGCLMDTRNFFLDKSAISLRYYRMLSPEKSTMPTKPLASKKMSSPTCRVPISQNHSLLGAYVQRLSEITYIFQRSYQTVESFMGLG